MRRRGVLALGFVLVAGVVFGQDGSRNEDEAPPATLGVDAGRVALETSDFDLDLVASSQTLASLRPKGGDGFDFAPADWLDKRAADGFYLLGDLTLRYRKPGADSWRRASTVSHRRPVLPIDVAAPALAAADLAPTLPADLPLAVRRYWELRVGELALRFELTNTSDGPVEIGALGIPLVFNNILRGRSLEEAHAKCSFSDPYIGADAGYVQVTRLTGLGPALVVVPLGSTPLEAYSPLLDDPTPRGVTFEGFYEWLAHSQAFVDEEWSDARPWNEPTSVVLAPEEKRSWGVVFLLAPGVREIEPTLSAHDRPVAIGIPGYVVPQDLEARLYLKASSEVRGLDVEPAGALSVEVSNRTPGGWQAYDVRGLQWGRARLTVAYEDGTRQTIHYKVIKPARQVVSDLGRFLATEQWFEVDDDPFHRSPSVISYDIETRRQVTEDNRAWIAGLGDEGGSGSWLAAIMKQLIEPDRAELEELERFVDEVLWGGLQVAEGEQKYAVRKSLFYWQPDAMPVGTYSDAVGYGGWSSWDREHAASVGRSYDYPHVAALHWVLYRLARHRQGLVTNHPWRWYLERAFETSQAMVRHAPTYARFGQMEGTVFVEILRDLEREGWVEQAQDLEATMQARADGWRSLSYPFGSEMPWDSTGQEEVYAWSRYFGYDDKAQVTLNAILGYMPTVPHWGYNGSARRYWDFQYAGKLRRVERQLHHYGSGLNAIPVLAEYRRRPDDFYLLRVGYGGLLGSIANITQEGFGPSAFHAFPGTLRIDGYSGDFGSGFLGHALNTATYLTHHPEFGWLAFGGNVHVDGDTVRLEPRDAARSRIYLAPLGLWLTLDAGEFESVEIESLQVRLTLVPADGLAGRARLRIEQPARKDEEPIFVPDVDSRMERGAWPIPSGTDSMSLVLAPGR